MNNFWNDGISKPTFLPLKEDVTCDALVVGGGLCGILTAFNLKKRGLKVVLTEKSTIGSGQTSLTTAKLTLAHGEIFNKLRKNFGAEAARIYGKCGLDSISTYRRIIKSENIDCDLQTESAYLYSLFGERHVNAEFEAAKAAGVPCSIVYDTVLPFEIKAAVKFPSQAVFHPLKFIYSIAKGLDIYENTTCVGFSDNTAIFEEGTVKAKYVVFATNYPALGDLKLLLPLKLHRKMAHACAFSGVSDIKASFIGIDGGYNYRSSGDTLIVSGEAHVSGEGTPGVYERIVQHTQRYFPKATLLSAWSAEDSTSVDYLPYIGRIKEGPVELFAATGFGTWGMSLSMTAATLIRDLICGHENPSEELFSPSRFKFSASEGLGGMMSRTAKGIVTSHFSLPDSEVGSLGKGCGKIVMYMGKKVAAYMDEKGKLHTCQPYCPHRKCELKWNPDDRTWDCPCHGSRFDYDGNLLTGPATKNI